MEPVLERFDYVFDVFDSPVVVRGEFSLLGLRDELVGLGESDKGGEPIVLDSENRREGKALVRVQRHGLSCKLQGLQRHRISRSPDLSQISIRLAGKQVLLTIFCTPFDLELDDLDDLV